MCILGPLGYRGLPLPTPVREGMPRRRVVFALERRGVSTRRDASTTGCLCNGAPLRWMALPLRDGLWTYAINIVFLMPHYSKIDYDFCSPHLQTVPTILLPSSLSQTVCLRPGLHVQLLRHAINTFKIQGMMITVPLAVLFSAPSQLSQTGGNLPRRGKRLRRRGSKDIPPTTRDMSPIQGESHSSTTK